MAFSKDEQLKRDLIKKHLEGWDFMSQLSVEDYAKTRKVSGGLFMALKAMMEEYKKRSS